MRAQATLLVNPPHLLLPRLEHAGFVPSTRLTRSVTRGALDMARALLGFKLRQAWSLYSYPRKPTVRLTIIPRVAMRLDCPIGS